MEAYPPEFAGLVKELALTAAQGAAAEGAGGDPGDRWDEVENLYGQLVELGLLEEGVCVQIKDQAIAAARLRAAQVFGNGNPDEAQELLDAACDPPPEQVAEDIWVRTRKLCLAAADSECQAASGDESGAANSRKAVERHSRFLVGLGKGKAPSDREGFATKAAEVMPGTVLMFSGCMDKQTSADVQNTASFGLPDDAGPGGAGGACTSSMLKALYEKDDYSWVDLLRAMREVLSGNYTQIPMLSSSREVDLTTPFSVAHQEPSGRFRALLVGINYVGSNCELQGCINDVLTMQTYLCSKGYCEGDDMRLLLDDGEHEEPNRDNITAGMQWLVEGAGPGDSLFFHYSGHGASVRDDDGDEPDGKDECLCPVDYNSAGLLRDDEVFKLLVAPLPEGAKLTCVLDCCHSGTILDLPYVFKADDESLEAADSGAAQMSMNPDFDFGKVLQVLQDHPALCVGAAVVGGIALAAMGSENRTAVGGAILGMASNWLFG